MSNIEQYNLSQHDCQMVHLTIQDKHYLVFGTPDADVEAIQLILSGEQVEKLRNELKEGS